MKAVDKFPIGTIVKHFKHTSNKDSEVLNNYLYIVKDFAIYTDNNETLVIYQALYHPYEIYARRESEFLSKVDKIKYPNIKQEYRFEKVFDLI